MSKEILKLEQPSKRIIVNKNLLKYSHFEIKK